MAADAPRSRRRPPSLRTRLLLILLLALLAVQVLSIGAVGWSRGQGARHLVNGLVARDVLQVRDTLLSLPAPDRAGTLGLLARADYRWRLMPCRGGASNSACARWTCTPGRGGRWGPRPTSWPSRAPSTTWRAGWAATRWTFA